MLPDLTPEQIAVVEARCAVLRAELQQEAARLEMDMALRLLPYRAVLGELERLLPPPPEVDAPEDGA